MSKKRYAANFDVVEVQQTFYQPPQIETLTKWREEVPQEFEFVVKAWQLITHEAKSPTYRRLRRELTEQEKPQAGRFKDSPLVQEAWETTRQCAAALGATRILFQCPASFLPDDDNIAQLEDFFRRINRSGLILMWEPRGKWDDALVHRLCKELDLIHVVDPFVRKTVTPDKIYWRLHGRGGYRYVYEDSELADLAENLQPSQLSYVMFNNTSMASDAVRFRQILERRIGPQEN